MPLAYYRQPPSEEYWSKLWKLQSLDYLLRVATRDPLTSTLQERLPDQGLILEAGCGLGQYVALFRQRGYKILGADQSLSAVQAHRHLQPESSLLGLDLQRMPVADGVFRCLISLGVIEHLEAGPQHLLREFRRAVAPGGTVLLSVPWVNGYRRLARVLIRRRQRRLRAGGAAFFQYAFTRKEVQTMLERAGFRPVAYHAYAPARGLCEISTFKRLYSRAAPGSSKRLSGATDIGQARSDAVEGLRRLLYWPPVLWTFGHMILVVAHRPEA